MLNPEICEQLLLEPEPRIKLSALVELRRLIDSQSETTPSLVSCAQSPGGGQDDTQRPEAERRAAAGASLRRRGDLDEAAGGSAGTLPNSLEGTAGKRSEQRRRGVR